MNYGRIPQDTVNKIVKTGTATVLNCSNFQKKQKSNKIFDKLFTIIQKEKKILFLNLKPYF